MKQVEVQYAKTHPSAILAEVEHRGVQPSAGVAEY